MTDRNRNEYKNQYKKETSQVHAPVDLIQRTRQAVAEEEQKMQKENAFGAPAEEMMKNERTERMPEVSDISGDMQRQRSKSFGNNHRIHYRKVYKWALPVAAAAVLMLVLNMSTILRDSRSGGAAMDSSPEMEAEGSYEEDSTMSGSAEMITEEGAENAASAEHSGMAGGAEEGDVAAAPAEASAMVGSTEEDGGLEKGDSSEEDGSSEGMKAEMEDSAGMSGINAVPTESSLSRGDNGDMGNEGNSYADVDQSVGMSESHATDIAEDLERKYSYQESAQEDAMTQVQITEVKKVMEEFLEKMYEILLETVM